MYQWWVINSLSEIKQIKICSRYFKKTASRPSQEHYCIIRLQEPHSCWLTAPWLTDCSREGLFLGLCENVLLPIMESIVIKYIGSPQGFKENCTISTKKDWSISELKETSRLGNILAYHIQTAENQTERENLEKAGGGGVRRTHLTTEGKIQIRANILSETKWIAWVKWNMKGKILRKLSFKVMWKKNFLRKHNHREFNRILSPEYMFFQKLFMLSKIT